MSALVSMYLDVSALKRQVERTLGSGWRWDAFGPSGQKGVHPSGTSIIVSECDYDRVEWRHASIARTDRVPSYEELCALHAAAFGDGYAYQQFVPSEHHVSIHDRALHLWGRCDGIPGVPPVVTGGSV